MSAREPMPRLVDAVFGAVETDAPRGGARPGLLRRRRDRVLVALLFGALLHVVVFVLAIVSAPSLEEWSAQLATRVHAELTRQEVVELPPAPPPPPPPPAPTPPPVEKAHPRVVARRAAPRSPSPPTPAQAGRLVAAAPSADEPPTASFVAGDAPTFAGGTTQKGGTSTHAVTGPVSPNGQPDAPPVARRAPPAPPDQSRPVAALETDWSCPWPHEADAESIDAQTVIIQLVVRSDGTVESSRVVDDPGHGFAAAARSCAVMKRFAPARDRDGHAIRASSPPIRVHFTR